MTFQTRNDDLFLMCEAVTIGGPLKLEEVRAAEDHPVACNIQYRPGAASTASAVLRWHRISEKRRSAGDSVDVTLVITRRGSTIGADTLDIEFPADAASIYDPDFAAVGAVSYHCANPDRLAGVEMLLFNEYGAQSGLPISVAAMSHGATGHQFSQKPKEAKLGVRLHLKAVDTHEDDFTIRLGRVFFGLQYDPYVFNPWYEHSAFVNKIQRTAGFKEIADDFIRAAREQSKTHKFSASQSFIMPFEVIREGTPSFPMLCGTINSLYWYGMKPAHGVEEYSDIGFVVPGDRVLDCGAHAGQMTALFGQLVGPKGKVIAFEPFPQNYLQVEAQGRLNKLVEYKSARAGVGETHTTVSVPNAVQMIIAGAHDHGLKDHVDIAIHKIDDYLDFRPTAIKLDIEGAEVAALRGAQRVMRECKPKILCEFHTQLVGQFGHTVQDFFDAIPLDIYNVTYSEEGKDGSWHTYTGGPQVWTMPGTIKAWPKQA